MEKHDIQGLIRFGYPTLPEANFYLLQITDSNNAKKYLQNIIGKIATTDNYPKDEKHAIHVAFTSPGLQALNLPDPVIQSFPREFTEGIHEAPRPFMLGDVNANDPNLWNWGGPNNEKVHFMIMCYAKTKNDLDLVCNEQESAFKITGIKIIKKQDTVNNPDAKEHFGFRDSISNPVIEGLSESKAENVDWVKPGEFVLGYNNDYDSLTTPPTVQTQFDRNNILPWWDESQGLKDLGKNGTFMVYRQMSQDVVGFWKYLQEQSKEPADSKVEAAIKLGAKMVGRWPNGNAILLHPEEEGILAADETPKNVFGYWNEDISGMKCPLGAHVRRANPRDWIPTENKHKIAEQMVRKHRLLRRGKAYGEPVDKNMDPAKIMAAQEDGKDRGLYFVCLVANIDRQFEFVQNSWIKSAHFAGLYKDADPIIGTRQAEGELLNDEFTCPVNGSLRRKYKDMPQFTKIVGGAYFFLPGIKALNFIANC